MLHSNDQIANNPNAADKQKQTNLAGCPSSEVVAPNKTASKRQSVDQAVSNRQLNNFVDCFEHERGEEEKEIKMNSVS